MGEAQGDYYSTSYSQAQRAGLQGLGNALVDRQVERMMRRAQGDRILEIGASSGEHLAYVSKHPEWTEYVGLDLHPGLTNPPLARELESQGRMRFVEGDASAMPFGDDYFDIALSTCVLAHVRDPEAVFKELRRVVRLGGQIIVAMPTDPGIFNRAIKATVTYRSMKRAGVGNPRLSYAREHINPVGNLLELAKHVYTEDSLRVSYFPFKLPTWNLNLVATLSVIKR